MANPKFLNMDKEEKSQFNFRLNKALVNKFQELAALRNITATDLLTDLLTNYLEDKVLTNTYLDLMGKTVYIKVPESLFLKECISIDPNFLDGNMQPESKIEKLIRNPNLTTVTRDYFSYHLDNTDKELRIKGHFIMGIQTPKDTKEEILDTVKDYAVLLIPNNLDIFYHDWNSYHTILDNGIGHSGIEFVIIPEAAKYTDSYLDCLYTFYFSYDGEEDLAVYLLDYLTGLKIVETNKPLKQLGAAIIYKLEKAKNMEEVKELAKTYNTGNIIRVTDIKPDVEPDVNKITANYLENIKGYTYETLLKKIDDLQETQLELEEEIRKLQAKILK